MDVTTDRTASFTSSPAFAAPQRRNSSKADTSSKPTNHDTMTKNTADADAVDKENSSANNSDTDTRTASKTESGKGKAEGLTVITAKNNRVRALISEEQGTPPPKAKSPASSAKPSPLPPGVVTPSNFLDPNVSYHPQYNLKVRYGTNPSNLLATLLPCPIPICN